MARTGRRYTWTDHRTNKLPYITVIWLFVVLGTVFLGTGFLFDRARRELVQALDPTDPTGATTDPTTKGTDR